MVLGAKNCGLMGRGGEENWHFSLMTAMADKAWSVLGSCPFLAYSLGQY